MSTEVETKRTTVTTIRTPDAWTSADWGIAVLALLVLGLVVAVIVLAVLYSQNKSGGGDNGVPVPNRPTLPGFTSYAPEGWRCDTRYYAKFAGNSHQSHYSDWTDEQKNNNNLLGQPNTNPAVKVANAAGQTVTFFREVRAPDSSNNNRSRRRYRSGFHEVELTPTDDPTVWIDQNQPCDDVPPDDEPPATPVWTDVYNLQTGEWCSTSYRVAYEGTNEWSDWSDFVDPTGPDYGNTYGSQPVLRVEGAGFPGRRQLLKWRRRLSSTDQTGEEIVPQQDATDPELFIDTTPSCSPFYRQGRRRY
jgi:hypothetical protein